MPVNWLTNRGAIFLDRPALLPLRASPPHVVGAHVSYVWHRDSTLQTSWTSYQRSVPCTRPPTCASPRMFTIYIMCMTDGSAKCRTHYPHADTTICMLSAFCIIGKDATQEGDDGDTLGVGGHGCALFPCGDAQP